uniref:Si:ch73-21g5.7 n=1 Tax=Amphilophus citrinellus TaxID=61819 RepID=A0A3Q0T006_AMPCI
MRDQHTRKMMILERKCTDRAVRLRSTLENQLNTGMTGSDVWDKTVSFFTVKKAFIFHNGYTKSSRDAMRLFPSPDEDVAPLC